MGMSSGPVIWDLRTRFNIETVGAQSQASVRERENGENKILFSAASPRTYKRSCESTYNAILSIKRSFVVQNAPHSILTLAFSLSSICRFRSRPPLSEFSGSAPARGWISSACDL